MLAKKGVMCAARDKSMRAGKIKCLRSPRKDEIIGRLMRIDMERCLQRLKRRVPTLKGNSAR